MKATPVKPLSIRQLKELRGFATHLKVGWFPSTQSFEQQKGLSGCNIQDITGARALDQVIARQGTAKGKVIIFFVVGVQGWQRITKGNARWLAENW